MIAGALAHESAKQEALEAWHSEHFPSMATWTATLGNQGFIPLKEAVRLHQALRTLPLTMDAVHTVWISEDLNWVTVFEEEPFVFTRTTGALPSHWSPSGVAWVGFDQAQQELSKKKTVKTVQLAKSAPGIRKPGPKIALDPRALRF
ncbi:MAG: hypothetical protein H7222_07425 [Methylotenera sp.]|nr:hypothetical protein [Oligoflexia bacterium]